MRRIDTVTVKCLLEILVEHSKYYFYDDKYEFHVNNLKKAIEHLENDVPEKVFKDEVV